MEVVATIGGAILSASLQGLIDKLNSNDLFRYTSRGKVKSEIKKWESMLKKLYAVVEDAEEKQLTNRLVKIWVSELRDLSYDVEDVVDEFATESVPRTTNCCFSKVKPSTIKFNARLLSRMERITSRLEKITAERNNLGLRENSNQTIERQPTTSLVNEAKIYGREKDRNAILELLKSSVNGADICVVPIIGMGGIGKTTLAQLVFNDTTLDFDMRSWVSVGDRFDVIGCTRTILQLEGCDDNDLDSLQVKLKANLSGKKFLVVLDDVWSENYHDWTLFCAPFEAATPGSRIIVTTRNQSVSLMMGNFPAYHLKELSNNDCLAVFAQNALGEKSFDGHLHLEDIGKEIVTRCQGLPLAAKAIGGLLRGKQDCDVWKKVLNSKIWDLHDERNGILPALRLSYHHLPSHLKRCFAYCAIFPKDYEFDVKDLVLLWMAEGFLQQPKDGKPSQELGHEYFYDLLSRSFFQESNNHRSKYVMHDLIRNLARWVNEEISFNLEDKLQEGVNANAKVRHASFSRRICDVSHRFEVFYEMKSLRTFLGLPILPSCYHQLTNRVLCALLPKLRCLMVLSLAGYCIKELPSSIGSLIHLRYLNLSHTEVTRLPKSLSKLFNLQTLKLHDCWKLISLPTGITNLVNLQHLDIRRTSSLLYMPPGIGNLKDLRTLPKFIVGKGHGLGILELMKLSHLRGELHVSGLHNVASCRDSELINLKEKRGTSALAFEWTDDFHSLRNERVELEVLNTLQPHRNLERLTIKSYGGTRFPNWLGESQFIKMKHLKLSNCRKIISLPSLGQLPLLRNLSISGMDGVKEVGIEFLGLGSYSPKAFPLLVTLTIKNMVEWERWSYEEIGEPFATLLELRLRNCPKLAGKLPRSLPSLKILDIVDCPQLAKLPEILPSLTKLNIDNCSEMILRSANDLFSLSTLTISRIPDLVSLHQGHLQALFSLESLEMVDCPGLIHLWRDGIGNTLASLRSLNIQRNKQLVSLVGVEDGFLPSNLEVLVIESCENLKKLPNGLHSLASLVYLSISNCPKLVSFPSTGLPYFLKNVKIMNCESLVSLPDGITSQGSEANVMPMPHLQKLAIFGCPSLTPFSIGRFPDSLRTLTICYCSKQLMELQQNRLSHLTYLELKDCHGLEWFPEGGLAIPNLIYLSISRCKNLNSLPDDMNNLLSVLYLEIDDCEGILSFPEGGLPPNLSTLRVDCKNLRQPLSEWGLHRLTCLKRLAIKGAHAVSFPDTNGLLLPTCLNFLWIDGFNHLKSLSRGIHNLSCLESLWIWNCPKLQSLPKEGFPATVGFLEISACRRLKQRCLDGKGDYWPIIAHIPCIVIDSKMPDGIPLNPWFLSSYLVQTWGHA